MRKPAAGLMALFVLGVSITACTTTSVDGVSLEGTTWIAISIDGRPAPVGVQPTMNISGGLASGSAGCNGYSTQDPMTIDGHKLTLGSTLSTLGRCLQSNGTDAPSVSVEEAFLSSLRAANHIAIVNDKLVMGSTQGDIVFARR